jgi:hypothetical protein
MSFLITLPFKRKYKKRNRKCRNHEWQKCIGKKAWRVSHRFSRLLVRIISFLDSPFFLPDCHLFMVEYIPCKSNRYNACNWSKWLRITTKITPIPYIPWNIGLPPLYSPGFWFLFLSVGDKRIYKHNLILHYLQKQMHELNQ